jgi:hypothetical protein
MSMGAGLFRSGCASPSFSVMITKKRSMPLGEIQGPVCVSITLLRGVGAILGRAGREVRRGGVRQHVKTGTLCRKEKRKGRGTGKFNPRLD